MQRNLIFHYGAKIKKKKVMENVYSKKIAKLFSIFCVFLKKIKYTLKYN